jgi:hypothetical protein
VRSVGLDADERPAIYAPFTQRTLPFLRWTSFVVRTAGDPVAAIPVIRRALLTIDPEQPVYEETTIAQLLAASVAERRFSLLLLGIFAIVALALATIGLYGLISFSVAERTREIGVRVALGASARRVYLLVLTEALTRTAAGLLIGLAGPVTLARGAALPGGADRSAHVRGRDSAAAGVSDRGRLRAGAPRGSCGSRRGVARRLASIRRRTVRPRLRLETADPTTLS